MIFFFSLYTGLNFDSIIVISVHSAICRACSCFLFCFVSFFFFSFFVLCVIFFFFFFFFFFFLFIYTGTLHYLTYILKLSGLPSQISYNTISLNLQTIPGSCITLPRREVFDI